MKNVYLFIAILLLFFNGKISSQPSTANYTFTATTNGSLTNMASGTSLLISPDVDGLNTGTFSVANNIGFSFYFMGNEYTQFVATEDGIIRFGSSLSPINRVPEMEINEPRLIPFSCDMRTGSNGKVHYKVTGSSPNRVFTIEWKNMILAYSLASQTGNSTFQLRLYETSNIIEYIYGYMYVSVFGTNNTPIGDDDFGGIGFCNTNANNGMIYKTGTFNNSNVALSTPSNSILKTFVNGTGEISGLSSTSDGYRLLYRFTPIAPPNAPSDISFSGITYTDITVNWTDNSSNEAYFLVYRSEDGGNTYDLVATTNSDITTATVGGLPSKNYHFKVIAVNEGGPSSALIGSTATLTAGEKVSNIVSGLWSDDNSWLPVGVPANTDNVTILNGHTITIDNTSAVCNNLTVGEGTSGILEFIGGTTSATLTTDGDVSIAAGGTFNVNSGATSGTRNLIIGNRQYANANLIVNGVFDMYVNATAFASTEFKGLANGSISGSGSTCNFYAITVNKGTDNTPILEAIRVITLQSPTTNANRLTITNGTFKLSSDSDIEPYYGTNTILPATGRLWLNHSGATINCVGTGVSATGAGDATITSGGILQITAGTFGYGAGANVLTINGTLLIDGVNGFLNQFGRFYLPNSGYFIMSSGSVNIDPQAVASLSNHGMEFGATSFVLATGGTITLVDPVNNTSYHSFLIPTSGEQNKNFLGSTLQVGNGTSSTSGSTRGFSVSFPTHYVLSLGNITVNNPSGTNRHVCLNKTDNHANNLLIQNLTITAGTFRLYNPGGTAYTVAVSGNITNSGTMDASVAGNRIQMAGTAAQTITSTGSFSATNNFELQISNSSGVTLNSPITILNLVLSNGKLTTTSTNILTLLAASTTTSGSTTSYVNGPLKRILPSGTNTIAFPVGKGNYNMIELVNAATTSGTVEMVAEVFDSNCGGSYNHDPYLLNTNRYWRLSFSANSGNFTNSLIRVTEVGTTTGQYLAKSQTAAANGAYIDISDGVGGGYTLTSNVTIDNSLTDNYFAIASNYLSGTYSIGSGQDYTSLTGAVGGFFAAVNNTGLRGPVTANITSNITETGEVALNQWNEANGSGHSITFQSSAAATRTISGSVERIDEGGQGSMIKINGADSVIFEGTTSKYLVFSNNTTNASNTSATFEIFGGATKIHLNNCIVENHNNTATDQGTITLGSGTNTSIYFSGNELRGATSGTLKYPYCAIYSNNSDNGTLNFDENLIYNFGNYGICFDNVGDGLTLTDNHFYKNLSDDLSSISQIAVYINGGNNHLISGNFIGGQAGSCGGSAWTNNASSPNIKGIELNVGSVSLSTIKSNTISNFDVQTTSGTTFVGIQVHDGSVSIGNATGNTISNITTHAASVYGIESQTSSSVLITNNTINSINAAGSGASTVLKGIIHSGTSSANINGNTLYALDCASGATGTINQALSGIYCSSASNQPEIQNNTIYNLLASNTGALQTNVSGIAVHSATSALVAKNKIYDIKNNSTGVSATNPPTACGIVVYTPVTGIEVSNNQISLGNSQTTNTGFYGIWLNGQPGAAVTADLFYNTVVIDGTASSGSLSSYSIMRGNNSTTTLSNFTMDARNNIFANRRNGGTGAHFAIGNQGTSPTSGWGATASNYNVFVLSDIAHLGYWNATGYGFTDWKTQSACDVSSTTWASTTGVSDASNLNLNNLFTNLSTANFTVTAANTEAWAINGHAQPISEVPTDYSGNLRSTLVVNGASDCGAHEVTPGSSPIVATQTGTIADGNTTSYSLGGRTLAEITWHEVGTASFPSVQVQYFQGINPTDDGEGTLATTHYTNSYWTITATGGDMETYTYDLKLYYDDNILNSITEESDLNVGKNPSYFPTFSDTINNWSTYNSVNDVANNTATISGIIGFSDFILEEGLVALPITLTRFDAIPLDKSVVLTWETATETNNHFFTIEKSADTKIWIPVTEILGAGTTFAPLQYQFTDEVPLLGTSYYRLKQTDYDGKYTYSKVKPVHFNKLSPLEINFWYDAKNECLVYENMLGVVFEANLEIYNYQPTKQESLSIQVPSGTSKTNVNHLSKGIYLAVLHTPYGIQKLKFVSFAGQ